MKSIALTPTIQFQLQAAYYLAKNCAYFYTKTDNNKEIVNIEVQKSTTYRSKTVQHLSIPTTFLQVSETAKRLLKELHQGYIQPYEVLNSGVHVHT